MDHRIVNCQKQETPDQRTGIPFSQLVGSLNG